MDDVVKVPPLVLSVFNYLVQTFTGLKPGAGTDAKVYIEAYGERGDTGRRQLLPVQHEKTLFEAGQVNQHHLFLFMT